jgi:methionine-rich copper-binding protein CopC
MRRFVIPSLLFASLGNAAAHAHAFLDHASPLVGSSVASAPREVSLTFTQNRNTMHVVLKAAGPGTYHVRWQALSVDTHKTEGSFTFRVGGP